MSNHRPIGMGFAGTSSGAGPWESPPSGITLGHLPQGQGQRPLTKRSGTSSWGVLLFPKKKQYMKYHEHTRVMDPAWGAGAKGREGRRGGDTAPSSASHCAPLGTPNPQHTFVLGATSPPQEPLSACIPCVLPHRPHPWVQVTWSSGTHPCHQLLSGHASLHPQCRQSLVQVPRWLESCWSLLSAGQLYRQLG